MVQQIQQPISDFIVQGKVTHLEEMLRSKKADEESCELDYNKARLKLPTFNIFDPMIQKNKMMQDQLMNAPKIVVEKNQLKMAESVTSMLCQKPELMKKLIVQTAKQLDVPVVATLFDSISQMTSENPILQQE